MRCILFVMLIRTKTSTSDSVSAFKAIVIMELLTLLRLISLWHFHLAFPTTRKIFPLFVRYHLTIFRNAARKIVFIFWNVFVPAFVILKFPQFNYICQISFSIHFLSAWHTITDCSSKYTKATMKCNIPDILIEP